LLNEIVYLGQLVKSHLSSSTQVLILANIRLGSLPEDIDHLVNLRVFVLQKNKLSFLPNSFGRLRNLEFCDLSQCNLTDLPQNFGDLVNLKSLIIHGNKVLKPIFLKN
jgi:internalin A